MEYITVKKPKNHRTFTICVAIIGWVLTQILRTMTDDRLLRLLILFLVAGPLLVPFLYFETWAITFYKGKIIRNRWGRLRCYTWSDIQSVTSHYSATDGEYIRIRFRDEKAFQFRIIDENSEKAKKLILKHTSITSM